MRHLLLIAKKDKQYVDYSGDIGIPADFVCIWFWGYVQLPIRSHPLSGWSDNRPVYEDLSYLFDDERRKWE